MGTPTPIEASYSLLPPPLSSLPAKYWTSISLWLHSYSVGRTFQDLARILSEVKGVEAPTGLESFIIGFIHDMGQKLGLPGATEATLDKARAWVASMLEEEIGMTRREAITLSKFISTNVAETMRDPMYPREVWALLRLSDRIQGASSLGDIVMHVMEAEEELGMGLTINYYNIASPHS